MDYNKIISEKVKSLKPSGIRKFFDLVANTEGVISLGVGEPDFKTPSKYYQETFQKIDEGETYYTSNWGTVECREAISKYLKERYGLGYNPANEILVTVGTSEALDLALRTIINNGDEVIIPEPCYVSYEPCVVLAGGVPKYVETKAENKFKLTKEELLSAITPKSKVLIMPYPSNPTGGIMTTEEMECLAEVVIEHNLIVISDELYSELTYGRKHESFVSIPGMKERTLYINGLSKAFAMTGWRIGYICGPQEIMGELVKIHQYTMLCASIMSQRVATVALNEGRDDMEAMIKIYDERRKYIVKRFNEIGLECFEPEGAFYCFPSIKSTGLSDEDFAEKLLLTENVAIVPGSAFGPSGKGFIRVCYAYSLEEIKEALSRIERFVKSL